MHHVFHVETDSAEESVQGKVGRPWASGFRFFCVCVCVFTCPIALALGWFTHEWFRQRMDEFKFEFEVCSTRHLGLDEPSHWVSYRQLHREACKDVEQNLSDKARILIFDSHDGGFGDQSNGLSTSLYLAMLTRRALFVNWTHEDTDFGAFLGNNALNLALPLNFRGNCTRARTSGNKHWGGIYADILDEAPCLIIHTNMPPSIMLEILEGTVYNMSGTIVPKTHAVGCAMRYLFSFETAYSSIEDHVRLVMSRDNGPIPAQYLGVHMRFGDGSFEGSNGSNTTRKLVADAIGCAIRLGHQTFEANDDWGIFFASDSPSAREIAISDQRAMVIMVSTGPCHTSSHHSNGLPCSLWGFMGDQLMLQRARGASCSLRRFWTRVG
mmetsp:Transcript_38431/g.109975  ORF Transcript_38431/g.109975 Transcript_38431/m.109975 type:complete len:382 (-) Transcript_38431:360-1505(-)